MMDLMDEIRLAFRHQAAHGFPTRPDFPNAGPQDPARWAVALTAGELRAWDRACAARTIRGGDDTFDFIFTRVPADEASAAALRELADARVRAAEARDPGNRELAWARESARRADLDAVIATRRARAQADAADRRS